MRLSSDEQSQLNALLDEIRDSSSSVLEMKKYIQHGSVSTYQHAEEVTRLSFLINRRFHLKANDKKLVIGAFLHDFYLYDWHKDSEGFHGFYHPGIAKRNAIKHFDIDKNVQNIIASHMWPLTITKIPKSREAWIVCFVDKYVSASETLLHRKSENNVD